jgi:tetratricopeptide (TPR) repeat protein
MQVYHRVRAVLRDELGLDPSPSIDRLHRSILAGAAGTRAGGVAATGAVLWVPQYQLPLDVADFVGREALVERLVTALTVPRDTPTIISVSGLPGVGKTALAVHVAHRVRDEFPDGQWYVGLASAGTEPRDVRTILADLIWASGVTSLPVRDEAESLAAIFRARIADRRVLLVLDDAANVAQLAPLMPGTPGCAVIVTGRSDLSGLRARHGAQTVTLDGLTDSAARELLAAVAGADRLRAQRPVLDELVALCAGLPLALRIAGANLAGAAGMPVGAYVRGLQSGDRLAQLTVAGDDQASVRNAFAVSYRRLGAGARRMFRVLGLVPGHDFGAGAAGALLDCDAVEADRLLRELATAGLLIRGTDRYQFHDLLRLYARERVTEEENEPSRVQAQGRLFDFLLHSTRNAAGVLYPDDVSLAGPGPPPHARVARFADAETASAWLETELTSLLAATMDAATHGPYDMGWRLADALRRHLYFGRHSTEWLAIAKAALQAAQKEHDESAEFAMRHGLGTCLWGMEDHQAAARELAQAITIGRRIGDRDRLPATLNNLGMIQLELGSLDQATDNLRQALDLARESGRYHALLLVSLSSILIESGQFAEARQHLEQALADIRSRYAEAEARYNLGVVDLRQGRAAEAIDQLTRARAYWIEVGSRHGETRARARHTAALSALGQHDRALAEAQHALVTARESQNHRHEVDAHNALGVAYDGLGDRACALEHFACARDSAARAGYLRGSIDALAGLARTYRRNGDPDRARAHDAEAVHLAEATGLWRPAS